MNKIKLILILLLAQNIASAQISSITRNKNSYTKEVFNYSGVRAIQIDEVNSPNNEENVFIFSKVEKNANPDMMYFQRFTKVLGTWKLISSLPIKHAGAISAWGSRKAFADYNKDKSVDALFIYALYDAGFKQQTVNLLFSRKNEIYLIEASKFDGFEKNKFSKNFDSLDEGTKTEILEYWNGLDKADD